MAPLRDLLVIHLLTLLSSLSLSPLPSLLFLRSPGGERVILTARDDGSYTDLDGRKSHRVFRRRDLTKRATEEDLLYFTFCQPHYYEGLSSCASVAVPENRMSVS